MESKKQNNTTGLKVTFIPQTNTKPNLYKITQTNNKKSVFIDGNINIRIDDFIPTILDKMEELNSYSLLVDNTQDKHYLFVLDFKGHSFDNILHYFKKLQ